MQPKQALRRMPMMTSERFIHFWRSKMLIWDLWGPKCMKNWPKMAFSSDKVWVCDALNDNQAARVHSDACNRFTDVSHDSLWKARVRCAPDRSQCQPKGQFSGVRGAAHTRFARFLVVAQKLATLSNFKQQILDHRQKLVQGL